MNDLFRKSVLLFMLLWCVCSLLFAPGTWAQQCSEDNPCPEVARLIGPLFSSVPAAAGGQAFSDDFERATLGDNWTVAAGTIGINTNQYFNPTAGSYAANFAIYDATALDTVSQYVKVSCPAGSDGWYPQIMLRSSVNGAAHFYAIEIDTSTDGALVWYEYEGVSGTANQITTGTLGATFIGHTVGITITGTGANTDVRLWYDPTGLPTAADNWNGDTTPTVAWTTVDPTNVGGNDYSVDTGNYVGLGGQFTSGTVLLDNFFGGDIP